MAELFGKPVKRIAGIAALTGLGLAASYGLIRLDPEVRLNRAVGGAARQARAVYEAEAPEIVASVPRMSRSEFFGVVARLQIPPETARRINEEFVRVAARMRPSADRDSTLHRFQSFLGRVERDERGNFVVETGPDAVRAEQTRDRVLRAQRSARIEALRNISRGGFQSALRRAYEQSNPKAIGDFGREMKARAARYKQKG